VHVLNCTRCNRISPVYKYDMHAQLTIDCATHKTYSVVRENDAMITPDKLRQFCKNLPVEEAEKHAAALESARPKSTVSTPRRLAHLMGQLFVECGGFATLEESFNYRPERLDAVFKAVKGVDDAEALLSKGPEAVANRVYANRLGNGNEGSGDGWKYRGSGYVQLTGKTNYQKFGDLVGMDIVANPDMAREPETAARLAFAFWDAKGCSPMADSGDLEGITKKINGPAMLGLDERRKAVLKAIDIWGS
jgi:putative chitinase